MAAPESAPRPTAEAVLAELRSLASATGRAGMARYGINTARALGIPVGRLRPIARRLKPDHDLAAALWASGVHEARLLAAFIDDPKNVTPGQMDAWAADFDSWDLCDQVCLKLFVRAPCVEDKIAAWADDEREFVRRAAFALLAAYAVHGKAVADERYVALLGLVGKHAADPRNFVKKAVNWALRQVGKRSIALRGHALALAERLAASEDKSARWIGKDAVRELTDPVRIARVMRRSA